MKNLGQYIDKKGHITRPFNRASFRSKDGAQRVLEQIRTYVGERKTQAELGGSTSPPEVLIKDKFVPLTAEMCKRLGWPDLTDPHHGDVWVDNSTSCLETALDYDCLGYEDLRDILSTPVQFHEIYQHAFAECRRPIQQYVDTLLFLLELRDPQHGRLRKGRSTYDVSRLMRPSLIDRYYMKKTGRDERTRITITRVKNNEARRLPEPVIATVGWEKRLRNDRRFVCDSKYALENMQSSFGKLAPYWVFSPATRCPEAEFIFLAFNESFQFDADLSADIEQRIHEATEDDHTFPREPGDEPGDDNVLLWLCETYSLEMIGTPFLRPPVGELHILAQQIHVTGSGNTIQVSIPPFYSANHLDYYLDADFEPLRRALNSEMSMVPAGKKAFKPRKGDCPLGDSEMKGAAHAARQVLTQECGLSPYLSYYYTEAAMSWWWPRRVKKTKKAGKSKSSYNDLPKHVREHMRNSPFWQSPKEKTEKEAKDSTEEMETRMIRWFRPPAPASKREATHKLPKSADIVRMIDRGASRCLFSADLYAWHKCRRELSRHGYVSG